MRVGIVGGGILGLSVAEILSEKNIEVEIFEKSEVLGGTLLDFVANGENYFNACHYLKPKSIFTSMAPGCDFVFSKNVYFSFTNLFEKSSLVNDFCGIATKNELLPEEFSTNNQVTLADKISSYPKEISEGIEKFLQLLKIDPLIYPANILDNFQTPRVLFENYVNKTAELKKVEFFDSLIAKKQTQFGDVTQICVPRLGYNNYFKHVRKNLKRKNVKIHLSCNVKYYEKNKLLINDQIRSFDLISWNCSPVQLCQKFGLPQLDNKAFLADVLVGNCEHGFINPCYYQFYDIENPILRIYFYKIGQTSRFTVEATKKRVPLEDFQNYIRSCFQKIDLDTPFKIFDRRPQKRYILSTMKDISIMKKLKRHCIDEDIIYGEYEHYGRNKKIENIESSINTFVG